MEGAVSEELYELLIQLQSFESLRLFALAGGTNLALRYNHRISIDIDLLTETVVGIAGFEWIKGELQAFYMGSLLGCEVINVESGEQYCFLRAFIKRKDVVIKVEMLQNVRVINLIENINGVQLFSKLDIGLLKLMSAANRKANKDIYDLDFITDDIPLKDLMDALVHKQSLFQNEEDKWLFDLDDELSPADDISLLLEFDNIDYSSSLERPSHSADRLDILPPNKSWITARSSWRGKVRRLMRERGMVLPGAKPIN